MGLLKKLKFSLDKNTLSKMYTVFIGPLLEYAAACCLGWLQSKRSGKMRKSQIMCSQYCYRSAYDSFKKSLYLETGWQTLSDRRKLFKLTTVHKIQNSCVPNFPNIRGNVSAYRTRNPDNFTIPNCRLDAFRKYFIPDTINQWNSVSLDFSQQV